MLMINPIPPIVYETNLASHPPCEFALPGAQLDVLDGPVCADGMWWWRVLVIETQLVGWTVEGDTQEYWLISVE
jgi:hypothetical protein